MVITLEMISRVDCIYKILFYFVSAITTIWYTISMVIYRCRVPGFPESRFFSLRVRNRGSTRANWGGDMKVYMRSVLWRSVSFVAIVWQRTKISEWSKTLLRYFSTVDHCCSICYGTKLERSQNFHKILSSFQFRTWESHAEELKLTVT